MNKPVWSKARLLNKGLTRMAFSTYSSVSACALPGVETSASRQPRLLIEFVDVDRLQEHFTAAVNVMSPA